MQLVIDYQSLSILIIILLSVFTGVYLVLLWHRQQHRLFSDLPFVFGVTFIAHAINNFIRFLPTINLLSLTLELFKLRAAVILATVLPLMVALLQIWWQHGQKYHFRLVTLIAIYWLSVVVISPSIEIILLLCIPLVLITTITLTATFAITWKTHRLQEVRSDLMVLSLILATIGQIVAANLIINSIFNTASTLIAGIALVNPWCRHSKDCLRHTKTGAHTTAQNLPSIGCEVYP